MHLYAGTGFKNRVTGIRRSVSGTRFGSAPARRPGERLYGRRVLASNGSLPGSDAELREALWAFARPMLSARLAELHRDAFATDDQRESTVNLATHRSDSSLDDLDLEPDVESDDPT